MKKGLTVFTLSLLFVLQLSQSAFAYSRDISVSDSQVRFSTTNFLEGRSIRIYASITNSSKEDLLGIVKFYDNSAQIKGDQPISLLAGRTDDVFVDWVPNYGSRTIKVAVVAYDNNDDDPSNNMVIKQVFVQQDTDHDGTPNNSDQDDDNDGSLDNVDIFPLDKSEFEDSDGDGVGNNKDTDDDNDEILDAEDALPLDPTESVDTDHDGIGNNKDTDDDGDGVSDTDEIKLGTDSLNPDTDGDGVVDGKDAFQLDKTESTDTDKDNIGNNNDTDDDGDDIPDVSDKFPLNRAPVVETDDEEFTASLNNRISLDASDSFDPDGEIVSYQWIIDGKYLKEGQVITHKFQTLGDHNIKLIIKDDKGESTTKDLTVSVLNVRLYTQIIVILLIAFLAGLISYKYLLPIKKKKK